MIDHTSLHLLIGGEKISGGGRETQDVVDPATAEVLGALPHASKDDLDLALAGLAGWSPVKGRGARFSVDLPSGPVTVLDDAYNANPTSMAAALTVLAATPATGRRIAYLADMKELGPQQAELHAALAAHPALDRIDQIHCIGPLMKHLFDALPATKRGIWVETSAEAATALPAHISGGDAVLAKGSLSMAVARVVDAIREIGQGNPPS